MTSLWIDQGERDTNSRIRGGILWFFSPVNSRDISARQCKFKKKNVSLLHTSKCARLFILSEPKNVLFGIQCLMQPIRYIRFSSIFKLCCLRFFYHSIFLFLSVSLALSIYQMLFISMFLALLSSYIEPQW